MPTPANLDPTTDTSTSANYTLGSEVEYAGALYRYVKLVDAVNATNGMVAEWATSGTYDVTVDRSGGTSRGRIPAGVVNCNVTAGRYCWLMVRGYHTAVKDAGGNITAAAQLLVPHASTDGDANISATPLTNVISIFGVAMTASASGTAPVMVRC